MTSDAFHDRARSLEELFFSDVDQKLLEKMREQLAAKEMTEALANVSGVTDPVVLGDLVQAGVTPQNFAALSLLPSVEIAWSDGAVSADERNAVLKAAAAKGIDANSAAFPMLNGWLEKRPDRAAVRAWKEYAESLAKSLPAEQLARLRDEIIGRARAVAEASGGFLGLGSKISAAEEKTLREFEGALLP